MEEKEEIDMNGEKIKKFFKNLDLKDSIIILLMVLMWLMYVISQNNITACNNYWLEVVKEKTINITTRLF